MTDKQPSEAAREYAGKNVFAADYEIASKAFDAGRQHERERIRSLAKQAATYTTSGHGQSDLHIWWDNLERIIEGKE